MGKEQGPVVDLGAEKRKTFKRMAVSGILAVICTFGSSAYPALAVPALVAYGGLVWNFRKLENLERQTSVSGK